MRVFLSFLSKYFFSYYREKCKKKPRFQFGLDSVGVFAIFYSMVSVQQQGDMTLRWLSVLLLVVVLVYAIFFWLHAQESYILPVQAQQLFEQDSIKTPLVSSGSQQEQHTMPAIWNDRMTPNASWILQQEESAPSVPRIQSAHTPSYIVSVQDLFDPAASSLQDTITTTSSDVSAPSLLQEQNSKFLKWTHHRAGVMKSAALLGIQDDISYILKNNDNSHFAYLGTTIPDIADTIRGLWWKTFAITDKNAIQEHWLFWDTVVFLLIPAYTGIKKLLFVEFKQTGERWFIQVDEDAYERSKSLFAELFSERYAW